MGSTDEILTLFIEKLTMIPIELYWQMLTLIEVAVDLTLVANYKTGNILCPAQIDHHTLT
jgi:hypothetical protein